MRDRIAERVASTLIDARRELVDRQSEVSKLERAVAATERAFDAGEISPRQYAKREARLTDELGAARAAADQASAHVAQIEQNGPGGDAEGVLLDYLAEVNRAVAAGVEQAPNLHALRNVLAEMFESVQLIRGDDLSPLSTYSGSGVVKLTDGDGNWCLPEVGADLYVVRVIRSSAFDLENFAPIRRELPGPQSLVAKP
jgi:hypothetical protein